MALDFKDFENLKKSFETFTKNYNRFLRQFLLKQALTCLGKTKARTPADTGNLRNRWELSEVLRQGDDLLIVIFNPVEYASFIENGHMQYKRFLPSVKKGGKLRYQANAETGVMLQTKWIKGYHMARKSITEVEKALPKQYEKEFIDFIKKLEVV